VVFLYPLYYAGSISLYETRFFKPVRYVGLENYAQVLRDARLWSSIRHSLIFGLGSMAGSLPLGLGLALLLNRIRRVKGAIRALVLIPWVMSQAVVGVLWMWVLNPSYGPVTRIAELLGLPNHTLPIAMLCFGRPAKPRRPTPHFDKHVVHKDRYHRLSAEELREASDELAQLHAPRGFRRGIENIGQDVYARKYAAGFTHELNRSVARWLERWQTPEG
jgi:hypothetical protein